MMPTPLLRESPDDFAALIDRTAAHLEYPAAFVERDYWITEILRSIAEPIPDYDAGVIFKGGTSLSKGWGLIKRMSEDVDALVTFGAEVSKGARDRVLKLLIARVESDIGVPATDGNAEKSVHRATNFAYPQKYAHGALTGERVRLELGTRGGPEPHRRLQLRSLIADAATRLFGTEDGEFREFAFVEIDTLSPERTLLEKIAALHHLATSAAADSAAYRSIGTKLRHAYDIAMLLADQQTLAALRETDLLALVADIDQRSVENGWGWTPRPAAGYANSAAFGEAFAEHPAVADAYARALELVVGGSRPSLREVADLAKAHAKLL
jgi:hypothetical protein